MRQRDIKIEMAINTAFGWAFGIITAVAAYGVLFCGATHHIVTIAMGAVACIAFRSENRKLRNQSARIQ